MAQELTLPKSFGKLPDVFKDIPTSNEELTQGIAASYAVMGYRGKTWMVKFGGEETKLMRDDGDGPRNSIEVVIVKANPLISKIYYKNPYEAGVNLKPDCWSANGITPDPSVIEKQNPTCGNCKWNAWGSRQTEQGKNAKACSDSRRTAIVPLGDLDNELNGGPMLLRIPPASLKDLKAYGDLLSSYNFPYYGAATRISFDVAEAYPKFEFNAIRPLTEEEAAKIMELRGDTRVSTVLAEVVDPASISDRGVVVDAEPVAKSPFELAEEITREVTPKQEAKPAPKPAAKPAPAKETKAAPKAKPNGAAAAPKEEPKVETPTVAAKPVAKDLTPEQKALQERIAAAKKKAADAAAAVAAAELAALEAEASGEAEEVEEGVTEEVTVDGEEAGTPAGFDKMLDDLL